MVNILKIRYFLDVAELSSFTRAAERNYIAQTAISQQIASLERELKVRLFKRDKGRVELTPAGASFYKDCRKIIEIYDKAILQARRIHNESLDKQTITIGYLASSVIEYLDDLLSKFNGCCEDQSIDIRPVQENFQSLRYGIKNGTLDMAIGPSYNFEGLENVRTYTLYTQRVGLLVSRKSALAKADSVRISDLRDEPVVMTTPDYSGAAYDWLLQHRTEDGFTPNIVEWADTAEMLTVLVGMNKGVTYLPEKLAKYNSSRCKMLRIEGTTEMVSISLAWHESFDIERVKVFIELLKEFFQKDIEPWLRAFRESH